MSKYVALPIPMYITCIFCVITRYLFLDSEIVEFSEVAQTHGNYCVRPREFKGQIDDYNRVALILHSSAEYVSHELEDQIHNWNAPISLSVYLDSTKRIFAQLRNRSSIARDYLSVHFVYKPGPEKCVVRARKCRGLSGEVPFPIQAEYPANLLRNVARLHHSSKYILIGDFDHLFSNHFETRMLELADRLNITETKSALVYRLFEVEKGEEDPLTKMQLLDLINQEKAITFHAKFAMFNPHYIEGEEEWLRRRENETKTNVAATLKYDNPAWEPQFVSSSLIPLHDEGFPYRIRDNTCLRWEMCRAGYKWLLVEDLFMFHRGVKKFASSAKAESTKIQKMNLPKFHNELPLFEKRLDEEYPSTREECPLCRYRKGLTC